MIKMYIAEFVSICGFIAEKLPENVCKKYLYIEPSRLRKMLAKNLFAEPDTKLRIWRNLGWLLCDAGRLTKKITLQGQPKRTALLNRAVYEQLQALLEAEKAKTTTGDFTSK